MTNDPKLMTSDPEVLSSVHLRVEYRGDHVIVTVPLGVLQNNQHLFKPSLNEEKVTYNVDYRNMKV